MNRGGPISIVPIQKGTSDQIAQIIVLFTLDLDFAQVISFGDNVSEVRWPARRDDDHQHRRTQVSSGVRAGVVRTNSLQHGCLFLWPISAPNSSLTPSIESKRVSGVRIYPAPPTSPRFSCSLQETRKSSACSRTLSALFLTCRHLAGSGVPQRSLR